MNNYRKNPICFNCGIKLKNCYALRCKSCNGKYNNNMKGKNGKSHPNWKGGFGNCIYCFTPLKSYRATMCSSCFYKKNKGINNPNYKAKYTKGQNNGNYKDGRSLKTYFCIDCNKKLSGYQHKRCRSCAVKGILSPAYTHGKYSGMYENFTQKVKEQIRKRDNYTCQNCGITEEEHIFIINFNLTVHHIDYDKKNSKENNLITLCFQCHSRTNYNREYWQEFLKKKVMSYF